MKRNNTPGPFPLHIQHDGERSVIVTAQGNQFAATHDPSAARLIAAAPELLEALIPLQAWAENERRRHSSDGEEGEADYMGWLADKARAAIAKAERGEG